MLASTLLPSRALGQPGGITASTPSTDDPDPEVHYWLGRAGACTGHKQLFVFCFDDSGSVTSSGGNDPLSKRYAEARLAIRSLARACRCGRELAAVYHWDVSGLDTPPASLDRHGIIRLQAAMRLPTDTTGTSDLAPVLGRVKHQLRPWIWRGWHIHLIVLSDFELTDANPPAVFDSLNRYAIRHSVTAVVLGGQTDTQLANSHVQVLPVTSSDPPGALAKTLFRTLTTGRIGRSA
jgi:hypothetical protein